MTILSPIILFCYNRPEHTKKVLQSLQNNYLARESDLFIFCDGPKNEDDLLRIKEVHKIISNISGFKSVTIEKRTLNFGLAKSVIYGVSKIVNQFEKVIVLEDDIVTSPQFLNFMNEALKFYQNDQKVFSISGFNFPKTIFKVPKEYKEEIFFIKGRNCSWGWATWQNRWQNVDFDVSDYQDFKNNKKQKSLFNNAGDNLSEMLAFQMNDKIDSWAIRVSFYCYKNNLYTVLPIKAMAKNIGTDGEGVHKDKDFTIGKSDFETKKSPKLINLKSIINNNIAQKAYVKYYKKSPFSLSKKQKVQIKYLIIGLVLGLALNIIS
jgi:hypothetical protein